jgi:peptide-methionine (S)-S-oxide reductase
MRKTGLSLAIGAASVLIVWCMVQIGPHAVAHAGTQARSVVFAPTRSAISQDSTGRAPDTSKPVTLEIATFGAGCFWGVEAAFRKVDGVVGTAVGFAGGHTENPNYRDVCTGRTGHAEVVQMQYDPSRVSFEQLLDVFWGCHDPTQLNRQGPDEGEQYRSVIFYHSPEQETSALISKEKLKTGGKYGRPIVTQIVPATEFYMAEDYHQQYSEKHHSESCGY